MALDYRFTVGCTCRQNVVLAKLERSKTKTKAEMEILARRNVDIVPCYIIIHNLQDISANGEGDSL